ncbi:hypothetical protein R3P38DRAFT_2814143 [Favolaschia claudopus]|uniref:Uncharacterized protein n=1 Tax=Favolaschia claudopus TaxID=2862362 RepID=A0AAV9Z3M5_9AGAR
MGAISAMGKGWASKENPLRWAPKPHTMNESGIARQNCECTPCHHDRVELGCKNPGKCVDTAKALINCIHPKWNPNIDNCDVLELNASPTEIDTVKSFDPNFRLTDISGGFRIFAFQEAMKDIPARRLISAIAPEPVTIYLHPVISNPGVEVPNGTLVAL